MNVKESITNEFGSISIALSPSLLRAGKFDATIMVALKSKKLTIDVSSVIITYSSGAIEIDFEVIDIVVAASANCQLAKLYVLPERL